VYRIKDWVRTGKEGRSWKVKCGRKNGGERGGNAGERNHIQKKDRFGGGEDETLGVTISRTGRGTVARKMDTARRADRGWFERMTGSVEGKKYKGESRKKGKMFSRHGIAALN